MKEKTVLIVDDEPDLLETLSDFLSSRVRVLKSNNGADALEILRDNNVDVILTDLDMPVLNGMELLRILAKISQHTQIYIPTIVFTGGAKWSDQEILAAGASQVLRKPLMDFNQITVALNRFLKNSQDGPGEI